MDVIFFRVEFFIRAWRRVFFPTLGGPTMATMIGGGSREVLSSNGICCFFHLRALKKKEKNKKLLTNVGNKFLSAMKDISFMLPSFFT